MNSSPSIELFSIGTELTLGRIQDTNAYWLAQQIAQLGGRLRRMTIVSDDQDDIIRAIGDAVQRETGLIIITGGLGPTPDDRTVQAVCRMSGVSPVVHETIMADFMRRRDIETRTDATPPMLKMATVPEGAEAFPNHVGWAPCIKVAHDAATLIFLPGPPREMEALFNSYVAEIISAWVQTKNAALRVMVNMLESEVSPLLETVMDTFPTTYLKAYVAMKERVDQWLPVDIVATGKDDADAQHILNKAVTHFSDLITEHGKHMELYNDE
ncbi:MAG: competence/damage-inducible protein A [Candidatus Latescibacteria bacterium]|jgi:molybdenum cofactor synthesis domain-containing protein|nr:competence/damage-inducible protein A [Candidatus Latescibacterota bacterium]